MSEPTSRVAVLLGAPVDDVTTDEAVDRIAAMVAVGRATGRVHQVATVNVDFLVNAAGDPHVLRILQRTDLAIPDGMPVVWGSRLLGTPIRQRTTGVDLVPALAARAAGAGHRIVLFGAGPGVAEQAAELLRHRFAGAEVVGMPAPPVATEGTMDDPTVIAELQGARPDIVCVALGNPKQERWIERYGATVGAPVYIGVGGTLDFLTGVTTRAPQWMQDHGLEWVHRAASEPRRLVKRYAKDLVVFGPGLVAQVWRGRRRREAIAPRVRSGPGTAAVQLVGPAPAAGPEAVVAKTLLDGGDVSIDVSGLERIDNVTLAALVGLRRAGAATGATVRIAGLTAAAATSVHPTGAAAMLASDDRRPSYRDNARQSSQPEH